jgi:hypothetical protein
MPPVPFASSHLHRVTPRSHGRRAPAAGSRSIAPAIILAAPAIIPAGPSSGVTLGVGEFDG